MATKITITANGDANGIDAYIPHDKWQGYLLEFAQKRYPEADVEVRGEPRTDGGNHATILYTDEDGFEIKREIDVINDAWEAASSVDTLWTDYTKD